MIKYSLRGLVVNGKLPVLFFLQYLLISIAFYSPFLLMDFFKKESHNLQNMLETFKGGFREVASDVHNFGLYLTTLMCIFLMIILIMSLAILYLKRRSNQQINQCRQNVFTLNSTLFWGLLHFVLVFSFWFTIIMEQIHVFTVIRLLIIFSHFIKSFVTMFENRKNFPELFSDTETNNRSSSFPLADILPRQETVMPFVPFRQNAR